MKTEREIRRTHDILEALILGEISTLDIEPEARKELIRCKNILCWVLGHDHNPAFGDAMAQIELQITLAGYTLYEGGIPEGGGSTSS